MVCSKPRGVSTEASPASGEDSVGTSGQMGTRVMKEDLYPQCRSAQTEKMDILKAKESQEDAGPSKPPQTQRSALTSRLQSASSEATSSLKSPMGDIPMCNDIVETKAKRASSPMAASTPSPASTSNSLAVAKRTRKPKIGIKDRGIPDEEKRDDDDEAERCKDPVPQKKRDRSTFNIPEHITIFETEPPIYKCNPCNKTFFTKGHCRYHEYCLSGEKPFNCDQCGQGFSVKIRYEQHQKTHTGEWPHVCSICEKGFLHLSKLTRHMRRREALQVPRVQRGVPHR